MEILTYNDIDGENQTMNKDKKEKSPRFAFLMTCPEIGLQ